MNTPPDAIPPLSFEGVQRLIGLSVVVRRQEPGKRPEHRWRGQIVGARFVARDTAIIIVKNGACPSLQTEVFLSNVVEWGPPQPPAQP